MTRAGPVVAAGGVVMRPTAGVAPWSVNHMSPSGPVVIPGPGALVLASPNSSIRPNGPPLSRHDPE